jgi:hypothetical protein
MSYTCGLLGGVGFIPHVTPFMLSATLFHLQCVYMMHLSVCMLQAAQSEEYGPRVVEAYTHRLDVESNQVNAYTQLFTMTLIDGGNLQPGYAVG